MVKKFNRGLQKHLFLLRRKEEYNKLELISYHFDLNYILTYNNTCRPMIQRLYYETVWFEWDLSCFATSSLSTDN